MLNKLRAFCKEYHLITRGDAVVCAVSGGADSMALLWALYLLKEEWELETLVEKEVKHIKQLLLVTQ